VESAFFAIFGSAFSICFSAYYMSLSRLMKKSSNVIFAKSRGSLGLVLARGSGSLRPTFFPIVMSR
jgi:hypothetical protein